MMADVAALTAQLEALRNARRSGASSLGYGDKRIEFRDDQGMQAAIAAIEAEIAAATGTLKPRIAVVRSTKGW
jgi:hypothetical protein